ncbi:MAG: helix-turn-helix domain-containing protein [Candidatus Aenigmatarchaeota archaeon]|nr:helix-turn-helix domain-containing protein [Candidatus Aenigmarchaeota archaeon]
MKIFCQTLFNYALPSSVKSIITKELIETYHFTQEEVAEELSITQPAVSQYLNGVRGKKVNQILSNQKLTDWIKKLAAEIASGNFRLSSGECDLCRETKKEIKEKELGPLVCLLEIYNLKGEK